ncbi:MAG: xanthine dehydrogenase family protein subunit M [Chloroflexi bacterium]|nr:xanthine dehydrogenase family protein subunit M [Chloroflexota bacterium]
MRKLEYFAPHSLQEALDLLRQRGDNGRPLAGGTDLVVQMKEGAAKFPLPSYVISLRLVPELKGIEFSESAGLRIGSAVTMAELAESPVIRQRFPIIADGAGLVGSLQTMNMATVGGNLCNAAPSADTAPPLLACEAQAVVAGPAAQRTVPLDEFFLGPGQTALQPGELLVELRAPAPPPRTGGVYARQTPRKQMDIAVVGVGVLLTLSGDRIERARIALGAVAPTPIRARQSEAMIEGQVASDELFARAAEAAAGECRPISDTRGSAEFRRHLVRVMTERMLREAAERAKRDA